MSRAEKNSFPTNSVKERASEHAESSAAQRSAASAILLNIFKARRNETKIALDDVDV